MDNETGWVLAIGFLAFVWWYALKSTSAAGSSIFGSTLPAYQLATAWPGVLVPGVNASAGATSGGACCCG